MFSQCRQFQYRLLQIPTFNEYSVGIEIRNNNVACQLTAIVA